MKNSFFNNSLGNIYSKPSVKSEITSQIIYGEKFKILSKTKNWFIDAANILFARLLTRRRRFFLKDKVKDAATEQTKSLLQGPGAKSPEGPQTDAIVGKQVPDQRSTQSLSCHERSPFFVRA